MARPIWDDKDTYPEKAGDWNFRQWAWSFLRRNDKFQTRSTEVLDADDATKRAMAREFGLAEYKHFKEGYSLPGTPCIWLSEAICKYEAAVDSDKKISLSLQRGEVALVFDLNQVTNLGRAALDAQLNAARQTLEEYLQCIDGKPQSNRISKIGLLNCLRVFDAIEFAKVAPSTCAKTLYPDDFKTDDKGVLGDRAAAARTKVFAIRKRALRLVQNDYLLLPPRDYRQDRSKG
jgi:hypothetical protein